MKLRTTSASVRDVMDAAHPFAPSGFASGPPAEEASRVTPMMEQYIEIKTANPDCLLFYRMGDFYELFFDDAEVASRALAIVLTKRGKHLGRDIPMCGVPIERADDYLHRLIALGHRVAVCEQLEEPAEARKRGNKSVVRRDVVHGATAERRLASYFSVATSDAFGALSRLELTAAAACVTYVERTQLGKRPPLSPPLREAQGATLGIDQATRTNLELARTLAGERRGSLLAAVDRSVTAAGSRLLAQRLAAPLTDPAAIGARHDAVEFFVTDATARADMRER